MRCLTRNKSKFFYALYKEKVPVTDEWGNETSEYKINYFNPEESKANISAAMGETQSRQFGDSIDYDKVIVIENADSPIDEHSVLWIDSTPELDENGALVVTVDEDSGDEIIKTPYDYIVKKVARSLNTVTLAVSKVTVSG